MLKRLQSSKSVNLRNSPSPADLLRMRKGTPTPGESEDEDDDAAGEAGWASAAAAAAAAALLRGQQRWLAALVGLDVTWGARPPPPRARPVQMLRRYLNHLESETPACAVKQCCRCGSAACIRCHMLPPMLLPPPPLAPRCLTPAAQALRCSKSFLNKSQGDGGAAGEHRRPSSALRCG